MPEPRHDEWIQRVLGFVPQAIGGAAAALQAWQRERTGAVVQLRRLGRAIRAADDPEADQAVILIEAIAKNLTLEPKTRAAVVELQRYLQTDSIIGEAESPNGFGIPIVLREPLLRVLATLHDTIPA